jgi:2-polyprenyl-3-methyl-5-hydroxy-6-metoxy-1,4-benzoquinol methylase
VEGAYFAGPTLAALNAELAADIQSWPSFARCPVCSSDAIHALATVRHISHDRCGECGFTFANPQPPESVRDEFYNGGFYTNYRRLEDHKRRADPYFSISMYTDMRSLARLIADRSPRHVLDFGCGTGSFLALLQAEFGIADVEGLEISAEARERARTAYGLEVAGSVHELRRESYDVVLLLEVIEHVPDPNAFFAEVARLVRPGGTVLITTPAVDNFEGRYMARHCAHYTAPSHVSLFTTKAMRTLLERHCFVPVHCATDPAVASVRTLARSLVYSLDYASPQHDEDTVDLLYRPKALGRLLGRTEARNPSMGRVGNKAIALVDWAIRRIAPRPNHFYVLAERRA